MGGGAGNTLSETYGLPSAFSRNSGVRTVLAINTVVAGIAAPDTWRLKGPLTFSPNAIVLPAGFASSV